MNDYRMCISSRGHHLQPREFSANSDEDAINEVKKNLDLQKRTDPEGTSGIVYLRRIDVHEQTTEIKMR